MKILSVALLLMATMAFVLVGCLDNSDPVAASPEQQVLVSNTAVAPAKEGPVVNSASGNPALFYGGKIVVSAFTAHRYSDGSGGGEYEFWAHAFDPTLGNKWHGKVLFLQVWYGNTAVIGGIETGQYGLPDTYDIFVVTDNGEGANAQPDMRAVSIYWAQTRADAERVWKMNPENVVKEIAAQWGMNESDVMIPVEKGNINVR